MSANVVPFLSAAAPNEATGLVCETCGVPASCLCKAKRVSAGEWARIHVVLPENRGKTSQALAEELGISQHTISAARKKILPNDEPEIRVGATGRKHFTNTRAQTAARQRALQHISNPASEGKTYKALADEIGVSPTLMWKARKSLGPPNENASENGHENATVASPPTPIQEPPPAPTTTTAPLDGPVEAWFDVAGGTGNMPRVTAWLQTFQAFNELEQARALNNLNAMAKPVEDERKAWGNDANPREGACTSRVGSVYESEFNQSWLDRITDLWNTPLEYHGDKVRADWIGHIFIASTKNEAKQMIHAANAVPVATEFRLRQQLRLVEGRLEDCQAGRPLRKRSPEQS